MSKIDAMIARLYRATAEVPAAKFRRWALEAIRSELPFDAAIWGTGHESTLQFHTRTALDVDSALFDDLITYRDINPISQYFFVDQTQIGQGINPIALSERFGQAVSMADLLNDDVFFQSEIYRLCFAPRGIARILSSLHVHQGSATFTLLSLYRFDRDHPFSAEEKALQQQLLYHLLESERHAFYLRLQANRHQSGECFALVDARGIYYQVDAEFLDLLDLYAPMPTDRPQQLPFPINATQPSVNGLTVRIEQEGELYVVGIQPEHPLDQLTTREWEVVDGIRSGKTFKTIARELGLSPSTVANHLYRIYRKLGLNNRNELLALAAEHSSAG
jgi:DNA-binding CsgD family transcriptional regulator